MSDQRMFEFAPRPEAHAMDWDYLMGPVRQAVRNLLLRIEGAIEVAKESQEESKAMGEDGAMTANCFLVYGERGTGKTTVLHSVVKACKKKTFFQTKAGKAREKEMRDEAHRNATQLGRVEWLPVLDLEPLPPGANLLTTLLTYVRNSLYPRDEGEVTSILEESAENARHQLSELINAATLMWTDIREPDTRIRANREVAAADIYARFRTQFRKAIDSLSRELGRRKGQGDEYCPIVLRIDNIDRSTDHLYSMVKLAEMVSCDRLWLVMAGDRQDVDTFLERAYWKELIRIGESGAGAIGKTGVSGEDEALVMARRQAAAASHRLLPPSHRIKVELVKPGETLEFNASGIPGRSKVQKSIRALLSEIPLIEDSDAAQKERRGRRLIDLFEFDAKSLMADAASAVGDRAPPTSHQPAPAVGRHHLTEAAELGLRLPARSVLDLWQLAYWVTSDDLMFEKHLQAERIARTMLRNVAAESTMSSKTGRLLQERILRGHPRGGTILDFSLGPRDSRLEPRRRFSSDFRLQPSAEEDYWIHVLEPKWMILKLRSRPSKSESGGRARITGVDGGKLRDESQYWNGNLEFSANENAGSADVMESSEDQLPDLVAAWLSVLHDVIRLGARDSTVIELPTIPSAVVVEVHAHDKLKCFWPTPKWGSFVAHDIHGTLWRCFLYRLRDAELRSRPRLLAAGWIACAIETFLLFAPEGDWTGSSGVLKRVIEEIDSPANVMEGRLSGMISSAERHVVQAAYQTYRQILSATEGGRITSYEDETINMKSWLEVDLKHLLERAYVPMSAGARTRAVEILSLIPG